MKTESVRQLLQSIKNKHVGYKVTVCDMDEHECLNFTISDKTDFNDIKTDSLTEQVMNSDVFAWKVYDDEDREIYIISEIEI